MAVDNKTAASRLRYPHRNLEDCERFAAAVFKLGIRDVLRSRVAKEVGLSSHTSGSFTSYRAAAVYFGLIDVAGDHMSLTEPAVQAMKPTRNSLSPTIRREAIKGAPLFSDIVTFYQGKQLPDEEGLAIEFKSDQKWGIPASNASEVASLFWESAQFAGAIDDKGYLILSDFPSDQLEAPAEAAPSVTDAPQPSDAQSPKVGSVLPASSVVSSGAITLNVNVELHLPSTQDGEVYDKLFAALRKHLLEG